MPPDPPKLSDPRELTPAVLLEYLNEAVDELFSTMLSDMAELLKRHDAPDSPESCDDRVDIETTVEFRGDREGMILLRCTSHGANDITQSLLMMDEEEAVELDEVEDAIRECANMMAGQLKTRVLDPIGHFSLGLPRTETYINREERRYRGRLAYQLNAGKAFVEVWLGDPDHASEAAEAAPPAE